MGAGLIQLVCYGKQDIWLMGNPQISFFRVVYRHHTNFSMESQRVTFQGIPKLGGKYTCLIPRNGDLLNTIYLYMGASKKSSQSCFVE